jgi:hypothetical protein
MADEIKVDTAPATTPTTPAATDPATPIVEEKKV